MIYKTKIINNIKYELIENEESKTSCVECTFNKYNCLIKDNNNDCFTYGLNAIWKISKSFVRKEKLKKINDKENV